MQLKSDHSIAGAILVVGLAIAYAIYASPQLPARADEAATPAEKERTVSLERAAAVGPEDHVRGTATPMLTIITYADYECPFCKLQHESFLEVFPEYADRVQWVGRHFPLPIHSKARVEAFAAECAGTLGGPDAFWKFTDDLYAVTPSNDGLDAAQLPIIAAGLGIAASDFNTCLAGAEEQFGPFVDEHRTEAIATGGRGTPWNIFITKSGERYSIEGAIAGDDIREVFNTLLADE